MTLLRWLQWCKDKYLGGDPTDTNWMQGLEVVGTGPFPLFGERASMQRARRSARVLWSLVENVPEPSVRASATAAVAHDLVIPGWLARECPPGSLVAYEGDRNPASRGRFRLYDGLWTPPIESDHGSYRILYLAPS